jgi:SNF family Na+-dependent transporter
VRERWTTRVGLILALAGNAVGLGNFLRFPRQVAENGGGAFMIPYFVCLVAIGIPLLWLECGMGRYGGRRGHGHTAGMFHVIWRHPSAKYLGTLGIFIPFVVSTYYVYVESWCLAYAFFSATGTLADAAEPGRIQAFLAGYQGLERNEHFDGIGVAYGLFVATFLVNLAVLRGGIARGIERLALTAMPLLFLVGIGLTVRVLTLSPSAEAGPGQGVLDGLGFIWNPDLRALLDARVWLAAAGQVLFTLSVGWGIVHTYASYIRPDEDVVLTGLSSASLNEFAEVILGGSIALTAAVVFFGVAGATSIAAGGSFDLAFQSMPLVLFSLPLGGLFATLWFLLLFLAGLTSSVALLQPLVALLQESFSLTRGRAVALAGVATFLGAQPVIFGLGHGWMDQLDFWIGSMALILFGLIESWVFVRALGTERAVAVIVEGAALRLPRGFSFVIRWVVPLGLGAILLAWIGQQAVPAASLAGMEPAEARTALDARVFLVGVLLALLVLVRVASRRWSQGEGE